MLLWFGLFVLLSLAAPAGATAPLRTYTLANMEEDPMELRFDYSSASQPEFYVKENGSAESGLERLGRIFAFTTGSTTEDRSWETCSFRSEETSGGVPLLRAYSFPGQHDLAVSVNEDLFYGCYNNGLYSQFVTLQASNATGDFAGGVNLGSPFQFPRRVEAETGNCVATLLTDSWVGFVDATNGVIVGLHASTTPAAFTLEKTGTRYAVVTEDVGTSIYFCNRNGEQKLQRVFEDPNLAYKAAAMQGDSVWLAKQSRTDRYTWNETGLTLAKSTTNVTISLANARMGIRETKDGDFLIHWRGSTARVLNSLLQTVFTTDAVGSEIAGCDMDLRNNYLACAAPGAHRVYVWDTRNATTAFGVDGGASTLNPAPSAAANPYDNMNSTFTAGRVSTQPNSPDNWVGVDLDNQATELGIGRSKVELIIAAVLTLGIAAATFVFTRSPALTVVGAVMGFGLSVSFDFAEFWVVVLIVFAVAAVIVGRVAILRGGE